MRNIAVMGLTNVETTINIENFPVEYYPVHYSFYKISSSVSGVGVNIARALYKLGSKVDLMTVLGNDISGHTAISEFKKWGLSTGGIVFSEHETAQSVIMYDDFGKRRINVDLKDMQEFDFPEHIFEKAVKNSKIVVLCNINFTRKFLSKITKDKIIATDVHNISDIEDNYNRDYIKNADILFQSHENLPCSPEDWINMLWSKYKTGIVVVACGKNGVVAGEYSSQIIKHIQAVSTRDIVSTIGAGDALFACFLHYYNKTGEVFKSIQKAQYFASNKIGERSASEGFLSQTELERLIVETNKR